MAKHDKGFFKRHKILSVIGGFIILIIIVVIVNGGSSKTNVNTTSVSNKPSSNSSKPSNSSATAAKVGSTVNVGGGKGLAVTLNQVIDPASGADEYTTPNAGDRFIAVDVKITNNGTASYNDDANSDMTVVGSDNQTYNADFDSVSECTNFNDGQYTLASGQSTTGCVVFQLPDAVKASKVEFQIQSGLNTDTGEWTVD